MKTNINKSLKINLLILIITSLLGFIVNKYFSKYMGVETLGLMRLFSQIVAYLNLAEMGIGSASSYALYKPLYENNYSRVSVIINTMDYFYKMIGFFVLIIGLGINFILPFMLKNGISNKEIYVYWSLYVINTAVSYTYAKYSILLIADQKLDKVKITQGSGKVIIQILQLLSLIYIKSFLVYILLMICENIYVFIFLKKIYVKTFILNKTEERDKNIIKDIKNLFWHKLGGVIVFNTDYIVLSKFTSLGTIGVYSSYLMIYSLSVVLMMTISNVLMPIIGRFITKNSKELIYKKWREIYTIYFYFSTFYIICTYYLIIPFVKLWLGNEYILSKVTVLLILCNLFISMTRGAIDIFKETSGFFDDTYVPFLESIINLFFSLILVQKYGLNGVIIGTLISNIVVILILRPILVFKRCFDKKGMNYIKIMIKQFLLVILSLKILDFIFNNLISLNKYITWGSWIYNGIIIATIVGIVVSLVFLLEKTYRDLLIKKVMKKI
ncbi:MAG: oligosaccharide flippase family protein [Cetobacterium sp.]|nr:oligosaccharide flippase family protein [Cetobacterium sp.]